MPERAEGVSLDLNADISLKEYNIYSMVYHLRIVDHKMLQIMNLTLLWPTSYQI